MGDNVTPLNWLGFAVCLCGISLHVGLKACPSKSKSAESGSSSGFIRYSELKM